MEAEAATKPSPSTEHPLDWIRQIPGELFQLDETPLLGFSQPFPWDAFTTHIERALQIEKLKLTASEWQWREKEVLFSGLGSELQTCALSITPLPGSVYWAMPKVDLLCLIKCLFAKGKPDIPQNIDPDFHDAFYRFLTAELIVAFEKAGFDKQISPALVPNGGPPSEHCLCLDVEIGLQESTAMHCRLFLSPQFRKSWTQRYQQHQTKANLSSPLADKLSVIVHLEAGKTTLTPSEWKQVQVGDLLLLDTCSLDPDEDKGRVMLVIQGIPFFRGRIKQGSIKILEHPLYHEVDTNMTNPPGKSAEDNNHEEEDEDIFEDSEFEDELNTEHTEDGETTGDDTNLEDEDFDISNEDIDIESTESPAKATPLAPTPPPSRTKTAPQSAESHPDSRPTSIEDVPLSIVVEAGRIQMSIKKILELQPGNMLDLNIHPEAGVDLVINGRRIAKGELLRIGDAIGVRIVELS